MQEFVPMPVSQRVERGTFTPVYDDFVELIGTETDQGKVTRTAVDYLAHIIRRSENWGYCTESQTNIAEAIGVTDRQVRTYQQMFTQLGIIRVTNTGRTNHIYANEDRLFEILIPEPPDNAIAFPVAEEIPEPVQLSLFSDRKLLPTRPEVASDKETIEDKSIYDSTLNNGGCTRVAETAAEKIELDESEPTAKPPRPDIPDHQRWKYEYDGTPKGGDAATQEQADGHMLRLWQNLGRADKVREIEERIASRKET